MENGVRHPKGKKNNVNLANAMAQESHQPVFKIDYPKISFFTNSVLKI